MRAVQAREQHAARPQDPLQLVKAGDALAVQLLAQAEGDALAGIDRVGEEEQLAVFAMLVVEPQIGLQSPLDALFAVVEGLGDCRV